MFTRIMLPDKRLITNQNPPVGEVTKWVVTKQKKSYPVDVMRKRIRKYSNKCKVGYALPGRPM